MTVARPALAILHRECLRLLRRRGQLLQPLIFFTLVAVLFPFALGQQSELTQQTGPAVVWISVLLATTLSLDDIFRSDFEDGSLEQLLITSTALPLACAMKAFSHWLTSLLPLIVLA